MHPILEQTWTDTEAQWIALKPKDEFRQLLSLKSILKNYIGKNIVLTPKRKLHITLFRGICNSLNCDQQNELMKRIGVDLFRFSLDIDLTKSRLESRGRYVTWHFDNDNLRLLQEKIESIAKKFLEEQNLTFQSYTFDPHITLGVFNNKTYQDQTRVDDCLLHVNSNISNIFFKLITLDVDTKIYLIGVNGLTKDILERTHHDLFTIEMAGIEIEDVKNLVSYAYNDNFFGYRDLRLTNDNQYLRIGGNLFSELVFDCLEGKSEGYKHKIYKRLSFFEYKISLIFKHMKFAKDCSKLSKEFKKKVKALECCCEYRINIGLEKHNIDEVRKTLIKEQPNNVDLYNRYLVLESNFTHVDTIFGLVKKIGIANIKTYAEYMRKLVKNKFPIETIRSLFQEACLTFNELNGSFVASYMEAERIFENGNFEKIEEYYNKRNEISDSFYIYIPYFRFLYDLHLFDKAAEVCEELISLRIINISLLQYYLEWKLKNYKQFSEIEEIFRVANTLVKNKKNLQTIYILFILELKQINLLQAQAVYNEAILNKIITQNWDSLKVGENTKLWFPLE